MSLFRVGVVGCGVIGKYHLKSCARSRYAEAVAVADVREEVARPVAEEHGIGKVYTDAAELFADPEVDGVVLALPANLRTPLALAALAAGKHVLIEKPAAMNATEVRQILAARGDRVVMCCQNRYEFTPSARAATQFMAKGKLGKVRMVRVRGMVAPARPPAEHPPVWRLRRDLNGGGIMANWGCYDLHYVMSVLNWSLTPETVLAQMWPVAGPFSDYAAAGSDAETHLSMLVRCADGAAINFERAEFVAAASDKSWEIIGEAGSLGLQMLPMEQKRIVFYHRDAAAGTASEVVWEGDEEWDIAHQGTLDAFARAAQTGWDTDKFLKQALFVQMLTDAAYQSSDQGRAVEVDFAGIGAALDDEELTRHPVQDAKASAAG